MGYQSLNGVEVRLRIADRADAFTPCPVVGGGGQLLLVQVPRGVDQLPWVPEGTAMEVLRRDGLQTVRAVVQRRTLKPVPSYILQLQKATLAAVVFHADAGRAVLVAGSKGGVGKTFVAVNVALLLAGQGWRVLLIDGDLGTPNVAVNLSLKGSPHIGEVLRGAVEVERAIQHDARLRLSVLPGAPGTSWSRPSRWLMGSLTTLIRNLRTKFDFVIVDTGSGIGYEVTSLMPAVDTGLFVTGDEPASLADTLELVAAALDVGVEGRAGFVLNRVRDYHASMDRLVAFQDSVRERTGQSVPLLSVVQDDPRVYRASLQARPYVEALPLSPTTVALRQIAARIQA